MAICFAIDQDSIVAVAPSALQGHRYQAVEFVRPEQAADRAASRGFTRLVGPHDDVEPVCQVVIGRPAITVAWHAMDSQPLDPHRVLSF